MKKLVNFRLIVGATTIGIACSLVSIKHQLVKQAVAQTSNPKTLVNDSTKTSLDPTKAQIPDLQYPENYNKTTPIRLVANQNLPTSNFISREEAIGILPPDARLISADLIPWGQHEKNNLHGSRLHEVSKKRMVWVVKVNYPKGIKTDGGFYGNAKATLVYEGETGKFMDLTLTCAPEDYVPALMPWNVKGNFPTPTSDDF